jgi:shikimate kinase
LEKREKYYLQAKHVLDVSLLDNYDKIKTSVALLRKELGL